MRGGRAAGARAVYGDPTADVASILGTNPSQFMKREGAVCGLIVCPAQMADSSADIHVGTMVATASAGPMLLHEVIRFHR